MLIKRYYSFINESIEHVILYHGSNTTFDMFDDDKLSKGEGGDLFGKGFYLTNNIDVAKFYAHQVSKKEFITGYKDGILGSEEPVFSKDADKLASKKAQIMKFKLDGNILNAKTFLIDDDFKNYIVNLFVKYSGYGKDGGEKIANNTFNYLKENKHKIKNFRGELEYVIKQLGFVDPKMVNDMIDYIKNKGYDGIKYESDKEYEGDGSWNYVIYNKKTLSKLA